MAPMKRVLVTGGLGFQGFHLVLALDARETAVTVLALPAQVRDGMVRIPIPAAVFYGSVLDAELVERLVRGQDVVYHLAALTSVDRSLETPREAYEVNLLGTLHVVEAAARYGVPLVYASTCEVYGPPDLPADAEHRHCGSCECSGDAGEYNAWGQDRYFQGESAPLRPTSPYAASKAAADLLVGAWGQSRGLRALRLRPCNVFGPGQKGGRYGGVIPTSLDRARRGGPLVLHGSGEQQREYLHVDDVVAAYLAAGNALLEGAQGVYNITSRQSVSIKQIICRIAKHFQVTVSGSPGRPGDPAEFRLNDDKFRILTGWAPEIDFWVGLDALIKGSILVRVPT